MGMSLETKRGAIHLYHIAFILSYRLVSFFHSILIHS